ncbi:MAG: hypothetical protein AVO35_12145 [Candidatus Aegiribacteria sp. MLS_C]|nr:MAG: hypothetical protein AVO35_12145 [Candidatus Aegiribacteria sp. MLS_C]
MRIILVSFLAVALAGCGGDETAAVEASPACSLRVTDSIGIELGDSAYVFGAILGLEFMPGGGFAVLDRAACSVRLYDDTGTHAGTISGPGSGPGQLVLPYGLLVWSNGDIGIIDPYQGGLLKFSSEGEYLGLAAEMTHNIPFNPRMAGDTAFVAYRTETVQDGDRATIEAFLGRFPLSWEPSHKYVSNSIPLDPETLAGFLLEVFFYSQWTVDRERGVVYAAPFDHGRYRILAFPAGGGEPSVIEMETEPVPKTEEEIRLERAYIEEYLTTAEGGEPAYDVSCDPWPFHLPIAGMEADDRGNLWVLRGDRDEVFFDVWDSDGRFVRNCVLPGFPAGDLRYRIRGDLMLLYEENPENYQKIYFIAIN